MQLILLKEQSNPNYYILDKELEDHIIGADKDEQANWLFLYPHEDFPGQWKVDSLHPSFQLNLQDEIGHYRAVSLAKLDSFIAVTKEYGYKLVFVEDPAKIFDQYEHLNDIPPFSINSHLEDTVNGFLPYQIQCYNKLKNLDAGIVLHSTGTGKTAVAAAFLMHNKDMLRIYVAQGDKKVDAARSLKRLAGLDSIIVRGTKKKRESIYEEILAAENPIVITNYEKFTADFEFMQALFTDKEVFIVWDEMPTKLKNRGSILYKNIARCLYTSASAKAATLIPGKIRPEKLKQIMMTETPIERAPSDFYNCVRLLDPTILGTVSEFNAEYVKSYSHFNPFVPQDWHNLEKIGLLTAHITHQADKDDPDIAKYFPKPVEELCYVEWNQEHRKIYDIFQDEIKKRRKKDHTEKASLDDQEIFSLIGVMQMLCDAPTMINESARQRAEFETLWEEFTTTTNDMATPNKKGSEAALRLIEAIKVPLEDDRHPKLERLREDLTGKLRDDKITLFTVYGDLLLPILSQYMTDWGVSHVIYRGTAKQKQEAVDTFKADPSIQVFLSSDAGAEGLDLPEANVSINYDLPWNWSRKRQRANRKHRVVSTHKIVYDYTYLMEDSVEDRKVELIAKKWGYHEAIFKGIINEEALSSRMTKSDLIWMLTGEDPSDL